MVTAKFSACGNGAVADRITLELLEIWFKTGVHLIRKDTIKSKIMGLHASYRDVQKHASRPSNKPKETVLLNELGEYFSLVSQNAIDIITNDRIRNSQQKEEDIGFINAIKENQYVQLGGHWPGYGL